MDISVVIVSYNTEELLVDCLNSLKTALIKIKSEVFVVDNDSHDNTVATIKRDFPWVKLTENKKNVGFSKANNQSLKNARGRYILVLNPDTKVFPDTIVKMTNFMQKHQNAAVATCRVELPNGTLDRDCRRHFPTPWRAFTHFLGFSKIFPKSKIFDQYYMGYLPVNVDHEIDSCEGAFMMIAKSAIKKVGYFDEDFFFYGEDLDWCWRFKESGYKIMFTPQAKIIHYKGVASGMKSHSQHLTKATSESKKRAIKESTRAMKLFYQKHLQEKYPFFINVLVFLSIKFIEVVRLTKA